MTWKKVLLGDILTESKILSTNPDPDKRITVRLNCGGVEKRPLRNDKSGGTKYYIRKKGQFIYGQQNFHNGAFGVIPKELDGYESSGDLPTFDISPICKTEWLVYFFKQGAFYRELSHLATGIGSKRIYPEQLFKIEIPLPSIEEQEKLLNTIVTAEEKGYKLSGNIEENKNLVKKLRQSILQDAIQGKLVPQDPNDEPASELLKRIKAEKEQLVKEKKIKKPKDLAPITDDEIPFDLPKGWEWVRLGEISYLITDGTHHTPTYVDNGIPFLSVKDVAHGSINFSNTRFISEQEHKELIKRCNPEFGDILLTKVGTTGIAKIIDTKKEFSIFVSIALIKFFKNEIYGKYLEHLINSPYVKNLSEKGTEGVGNKNLVLRKIVDFVLPLPPLAEQHRIVAKVDELMNFCDGLEKEVTEAKENGEKLMESVLGEVFR